MDALSWAGGKGNRLVKRERPEYKGGQSANARNGWLHERARKDK